MAADMPTPPNSAPAPAAQEKHQPDLFDKPKNAKLVRAIDEVNEKFGKGALIYGDAAPDQTSKIAFQRVPKVKEF
jgi:hypothetical protein